MLYSQAYKILSKIIISLLGVQETLYTSFVTYFMVTINVKDLVSRTTILVVFLYNLIYFNFLA